MKTYDNLHIRTLLDGSLLMDDGGNPPTLNEIVLIGGKKAKVTLSRKELVNDTSMEGRFVAIYL